MGTRGQRHIIWLAVAVAALLAVPGAGAAGCGDQAAGSAPPEASTSASTAGSTQLAASSPVGPVPAVSYAEPPESNPTSCAEDSFWVDTVGWKFRPTVDVEVTHLGFYDAEQDGLAGAHRVGIFDAATDRLVASVIVVAGSSLEGAFRWESLDVPADLKAGHAYLVACECVIGDALYDAPGDETWSPEIDHSGLFWAADGFVAPHQDNAWLCFWGPNFKFMPATAASSAQARPASDEVVALLESRMAAMNRGDGLAAAEFYALDAAMEETDLTPHLVTLGRAAIGERLQSLVGDAGLRLISAGTPIQFDRYVAEPVVFDQDGGPGHGAGMLVFEIDSDGLIAYQWVIGWVDSP
jgi:hypothetical protein